MAKKISKSRRKLNMSREVEQFRKYVENNEITVSIDWETSDQFSIPGEVHIKVNGSISRVWVLNQ